nr:unnamed protein product [Digitaria exilis]
MLHETNLTGVVKLNVQNWYCCAKMKAEITATEEAEITATEEAERLGLHLAVVLPCMTIGPMLQKELNVSNHHVLRYLMGVKRSYPTPSQHMWTSATSPTPGAAGRYLCAGVVLHRAQLVAKRAHDLGTTLRGTALYGTAMNRGDTSTTLQGFRHAVPCRRHYEHYRAE